MTRSSPAAGRSRRRRRQSQAALALAERRYQVGAVSFRDVLDAEDRAQAAQLALTASTAATSEDLVLLYKSLGGGWADVSG